MSYNNLIDRNLDKSFKLAKDLAIDVTLLKKSGISFDFSQGTVAETTSENTSVKMLVIKAEKLSQKRNVVKKTVMLRHKQVGSISIYDSLSENGQIWKFGPKSKDNGFISVLEIFKEA